MLANDLANHLKTFPFYDEREMPVRVASLEAEQSNGVMVMTPLGGLTRVGEIPRYYQGNMQIIVRHRDPVEGDRIAREIMDAMTVIGKSLTLEDYRLSYFNPRGEPIMYPINDAGLFEHSVNFDCRAYRL